MVESFQLVQILPGLLDICFEAGTAILDVYETPFEVENKDDKSPLTLADKRSHEIIVNGLKRISFNGCVLPVLSEEGREMAYEERRRWECFWLVDPLDGTKEFIKQNGEFTVNIALVQGSKPVLGIIHVPVRRISYFAIKGMGAYRLDDGLPEDSSDIFLVSKKLPCEGKVRPITVVGSRSHMSRETEEYVSGLKEKHGKVEITTAGSSLKFCLVAEGKADVYPRFAPTMEWDTGAGQIILEEAGGAVIRSEDEQPLLYNKENLVNPWFVAVNSMMWERKSIAKKSFL